MVGMGDGQFDPDGTTTRAMIVSMLHRMEGEPQTAVETPFEDVEKDAWYADGVAWAQANGIVYGVGEGLFAPMEQLTREQLVTILWRYAAFKGIDTSAGEQKQLSDFDDVELISKWAAKAFNWAVDAGIISGVGERKISPQTDASRAQAATMLMRYSVRVAP